MQKLTQLFDYQKFHSNPRLAAMIHSTESRYLSQASTPSRRELDEDTLSLIHAAGNTDQLAKTNIKSNQNHNPLKDNPFNGVTH